MHTYTLFYSKLTNTIWLHEWELQNGKEEEVRNRGEIFSYTILDCHPVKDFFNQVKTGLDKIEFKGTIFNIVRYDHDEREIKFTSEAEFGTVARTLLRFKNKYKISVDILKEEGDKLYDLRCVLKVEYVPHLDTPKRDFLIFKSFYTSSIFATETYSTNNYFDLIMRYKNGIDEWEGIFADIEGDGDCEIEIGRKTFCTVYTDKTLDELKEFLLDSKNLKNVS